MLGAVPQVVVDLGITAGVVSALIAAGYSIVRFIRSLHQIAVDEITQVVELKIENLRAELKPNGGSSFRDEVMQKLGDLENERRMDKQQITIRLATFGAELAEIKDRLDSDELE